METSLEEMVSWFRLELAETRSGLVRGARLVEGGQEPRTEWKGADIFNIYT